MIVRRLAVTVAAVLGAGLAFAACGSGQPSAAYRQCLRVTDAENPPAACAPLLHTRVTAAPQAPQPAGWDQGEPVTITAPPQLVKPPTTTTTTYRPTTTTTSVRRPASPTAVYGAVSPSALIQGDSDLVRTYLYEDVTAVGGPIHLLPRTVSVRTATGTHTVALIPDVTILPAGETVLYRGVAPGEWGMVIE